MQYLLLIYEAEQIWESKTDAEKLEALDAHGVLNNKMDADGVEHTGQPLMPTSTAISVRRRGGDVQVTDGPFAETKEQLSGFYLVDVDNMDAALEYAAMIPHSETGTIEVRPVADHSGLRES